MGPRPSDVLHAGELTARQDEFIDMYNEVLSRLSEAPGPLDHFFAQQITGTLWRIGREGEDAEAVLNEVILKTSHSESRANALQNMDNRTRMRALATTDLKALLQVREALVESIEAPATLRVLEGGKR